MHVGIEACWHIVPLFNTEQPRLEHSFGTGDRITQAWVMPCCSIECTSEGFVEGFDFVMIVTAVLDTGVQIHSCVDGRTLKEMKEHISCERAHPWRREFGSKDAVRSATQVDSHKSQRLVHRHIAMRCTDDTGAITQRLINCLTEAYRNILGSVVIVDMEIPNSLYGYVKLTMLGKEGQHVIEEADTCISLTLTCPIDIQRKRDSCFTSRA